MAQTLLFHTLQLYFDIRILCSVRHALQFSLAHAETTRQINI
jgi:hypothetical protein